MLGIAVIFLVSGVAIGDPISTSSNKIYGTNPFSPQGLIVGGKLASIEDHPWQVSLQTFYGFHFCGGSIIAEDTILTAGHCTTSYSASAMSVRLASNRTSEGGYLHKVKKIVRHENFRTNAYGIPQNDVAILKLETPIKLNERAKPIALFDRNEESPEGAAGTLSGWGALREGGGAPEYLHTVDVPIVSKAACNEAYSGFGGVPAGQICAAYPAGGKDTCQGDSGGPLVIGNRQAGIVSWGNGCARKGWPGVYTEIAAQRDWLTKNAGVF